MDRSVARDWTPCEPYSRAKSPGVKPGNSWLTLRMFKESKVEGANEMVLTIVFWDNFSHFSRFVRDFTRRFFAFLNCLRNDIAEQGREVS